MRRHLPIPLIAAAFVFGSCSSTADPGAVPGAPLFDGMGSYSRKVTTTSPLAQRYFDQGLRLYYAFNHQEAIRSFREGTRLDPGCAMCYWGIALAYGPIPGVPVPAGAPGDSPDGTVALAWIARHLKSLPARQRTAIAERLGVPLPGSAHASGPPAALKRDARLEAMADGFAAQFQQRTAHALRLDVQAGWVPSLAREHAGGAAADALPVDAHGELSYTNASTCRIRISRADHGSASAAYVANTVAHEVFHCIQFDAAPTRWSREDGTWVIEGGAEWAASQVAPVGLAEVSSDPEAYFAADQPLFGLAHSAAYFWGRLAETNGPPWTQTLAAAKE